MKRQSYKVSINNPCEKEWASMTQNETGRHCSHCSTTVVDFTQLTDNEIVNIVKQTPGRLCGRLTNQQLSRTLETTQHSNNSWLYKILAGFLLIATTENSMAKNRPALPIEILSATDNEKLTREAKTNKTKTNERPIADSLKNSVKGTVFEENTKKPLPSVSVLIKGTAIGTKTDHDGKFDLIIPDSLVTDRITLVVMFIGYETMEITVERKDLPIIKELSMAPFQNFIDEIVIKGMKKWWQFWK